MAHERILDLLVTFAADARVTLMKESRMQRELANSSADASTC